MSWRELDKNILENKYDHYSFDFWCTIAFSNPEFKNERCKYIISLSSNELLKEDIELAFTYISNDYNKQMENGGKILKPVILYKKVFEKLGLNNIDFQEVVLEIDKLFIKYPPLISSDFLNCYKKIKNNNSTISITSNTAYISGDLIIEILNQNLSDVSFNMTIFSELVGVSKPSREIFELVKIETKKLYQKEVKILHIGDNPITDYSGPILSGIDALLI